MKVLKIFLEESCCESLKNTFQSEGFSITSDASEADAIIFQAHKYSYIKNSHLFKDFKEKCFNLTQSDFPGFFLPGIYASNYRHFFRVLTDGRTKTFSYFYIDKNSRNQYIDPYKDKHLEKKYLFSFIGGPTSHLRRKIFKIYENNPSNNFLVRSSLKYNHWDATKNFELEKKKNQENYVKTVKESLFCICPRGAGHSSIRLFEAMELGICPVIIADRWIPPVGPKWEDFSVFIQEKDIAKLEDILSPQSNRALLMGEKAREAFDKYFSDEVRHEQIHRLLLSLIENRDESQENLIHYFFPLLYNSNKFYNNITQSIKKLLLLLGMR
ncbi:exostosin family protein [Nodosilinea sp. E11]|uniref:exostosin domain-containing protein n=1 Tax=Nodosilinea sp. E11 TaxID=3037479 RepID=UPI0029344690|nr:exostosin family protein [Nodosilinea sp. E11]WOD41568.1 exostosin family protein [Nodosilinea sp. E11]